MKQYVIQIKLEWKNKEKQRVISYSYFQQHTGYPIPLNHLSGINDCKKYETRAAALIDWRKYYRNKRAKVITIPA